MTDTDGFIDYALVTASKIAVGASSVLLKLRGASGAASTSAAEEPDDCETWGEAAILARPADATSAGQMEVVVVRLGDELVAIASKDRRWQMSVEKGEVVVRAFGASAGYVHLKPNGEILVKGQTVKIGLSATQHMTLGDVLQTYLNALKTWLDLHTHVETGGTTNVPSPLSPAVPTVTSATHLVEP